MKSRTWFLLSLMLFIAAAFFWRLGEERRAVQQNAKQKASVTDRADVPLMRDIPIPAKRSGKQLPTDADAAANSSSTNAPELYPHRLKNTSQTIDELVRNDRAILLRNALIDTGAKPIQIPDELRAKDDSGSYIVQARGVVGMMFRAALSEAKAEIISYVPNNAYLVRMDRGGAEKLRGNKWVKSISRYEPYYKLDTDLLAMAMEKKELPAQNALRVTLFPGERESALAALKGKATVIGEDAKSSPFGPELIVASADLIQLANLPQVQEIEPFLEREVRNDLTRVRLGVAANTVVADNYLQLGTSSNILVNVNDTTIDNGHPDLDGRVFPLGGVGITDEDGHGTHVAGIIASSGANGPSGAALTEIGSLANANFRGKAPGATILSLDIFNGFSDAELQQLAGEENYVTRSRLSPLISNNSWGYGTRNYNSSSASFDAAVRDALPGSIGSQPIAYVFAAGNSGGGNNSGQGGFPGSVISPGNAKNVITVGALENKRNITNDIIRPNASCVIVTNKEFLGMTDSSNQIAFFSSRGNVGVSQEGTFGRLKPDIVEPGTFIVSTRSRQFDEASYYSPLHNDSFTFPGLVLDPFGTNFFSTFVPDNPCNEGATLTLTIEANIVSPITTPPLQLQIYAGPNPVPSASGTPLGVNSVTIDRANLPLNDILYYDIVNTNDVEIVYNLRTSLLLSNDLGNYFQVLSNLNSKVGPNYIFESGTSMSAPAISGMLALMQEFFEERFQITNTPAMMKALLINGSRSAGPGYTYERERSLNIQGWGLPDLRRILPTNGDAATWPVQLFDQSTNVTLATGERHDRLVTMNDTNSPLRITLVWTDPPGNPAVGVKLVNDLDLIVTTVSTNGLDTNGQPVISTNVYFGNNFPGGEFTQASELGTNGLADFEAVRDSVNNVENVYINGPLEGAYTVSVVAKRVNVNAVTAHTNAIVQDYALVISSGNLGTAAPFTVDTNSLISIDVNTNSAVTIVSNGIPLFKQRVGANSPIQNVDLVSNLTDGTNTQWAFYVLNNPSNFTNIAFLTFLPPNLSGATNTVPGSRRIIEADIDMYVSTDPTLTNLNPGAIASSFKSLNRGGQELIVFTNRNDPVFYVGIKSEDQRAAEFSFFAVASDLPFSETDENGNIIVRGIVPPEGMSVDDGSPDSPGGAVVPLISVNSARVGRVIVTNTITHERIGDLIETLTHAGTSGDISVVLLNHSFPTGEESVTDLQLIFDDSGIGDVVGARHTDGPGSLNDFIDAPVLGAWLLTLEDNALNATGKVVSVQLLIEPALETNSITDGNGFTISGGIPAGQSRAVSFLVPLNATNMIISISPKEGPLDTVVRRGRLPPTRSAPGGPYVDKGRIIDPPGGILTVGTNDTPPLRPGRYVLRLFNDGAGAVEFTGVVRFELDLTARSFEQFLGGPNEILDDATINSTIFVDRAARVVSTEVGVRIDHSRVSDLVLHLVSPEGTRILLAENRGGLSTNGYGSSVQTTNVYSATFNGGPIPHTNVIQTTANGGIITITYDFYDLPDQLQVFYEGNIIHDTGLTNNLNGPRTISVSFGPGVDTNVVVVVNGNGNPQSTTAWDYTATVFSGELIYASFSENTNLARVPIKFAIPPFATNIPGSNIVNFLLPDGTFETVAPGTYTGSVEGWAVTNSVDVIGDATFAHRGTNFVSLGNGGISRTLPTVKDQFYNLKFAYRRDRPENIASATIKLEGVFTNDFAGYPSWRVHSTSFAAPKAGTALSVLGFSETLGGAVQLLANGSFEDGLSLTSWTVSGNAEINPYTGTASHGTNFVAIGRTDVAGSSLSQSFPVTGGSNYVLTFDIAAAGNAGGTGMIQAEITTPSGPVASQTYSIPVTASPFVYQTQTISFTAPLDETATLRFLDVSPNGGIGVDPILDNVRLTENVVVTVSNPGMWFDTFELTEGGDPNYFLPEESLNTLIGENARGNWKLEIWDNRAGAPLAGGHLISWQLNLTFASTNVVATPVISGNPLTNTVVGSEMKFFVIDVPIFATQATNILVSFGGPLNLWFNQDEPPLGNPRLGDFLLLSSTVNGTHVLTTTGIPDLRPGGRYYLGVQNADPSQSNAFSLTVTFDNTNNLVNVIPLTNAVSFSTNLPLGRPIQYYQYDLSNAVESIEFRLFGLTADADLVVRRGALPTVSSFDYNSTFGGTFDEVIVANTPLAGRYYLGVYGFFPTAGIDYTIMVTEGTALPPLLRFTSYAITPAGFQGTADTIVGRTYELQMSTDLFTWTTIETITAVATTTTFTDPTPPDTQTARYYRLRLVP